MVFPKSPIKDYEFIRTTPNGLNKRTAIWVDFKADSERNALGTTRAGAREEQGYTEPAPP